MSLFRKPKSGVRPASLLAAAVSLGLLLSQAPVRQALAQAHTDHTGPQHDTRMSKSTSKKSKPSTKKKDAKPQSRVAPRAPAQHVEHGTVHDGPAAEMKGFFGPYSITREGSGTSWLPDATPHEGIHATYGDWMVMTHALINGIYNNQGGPRGGNMTFVNGMLMGMAQRTIGDGTLGFRAMLAPDPFMGPRGYPLIFATGETADGKTQLIDRQHPHELFMELATSYSYKLSATSSVFIYAGLPGEPALGPPAFMHRTSGMDIPEAPLSHHWLDSTHITFGVVTVGMVLDKWKIEASAFRGREPDQNRFDIEAPRLDSWSTRLTWNPVREVSMQVSYGQLRSPEQLAPDVDEDRITASVIYTRPFGDNNLWSTTFAWGRKINRPGNTLDGFLLESAVILNKTWTLFARAELVQEDELLENLPIPIEGIFPVSKLSVGGIYDFKLAEHLKLGIGALVSVYGVPAGLKPFYGDPTSYMVFFRLKVS